MENINKIDVNKEKRRTYMREYKRRQYELNREQSNTNQKIYYHIKNNPNVDLEEFKNISVMRAEFVKVICNLQKIKEQHPNVLKEYLTKYLEDIP